MAGVVGSEASKSAGDSDEELDALGEKTSMKELINQINQMNDKIPKRFEKLQEDMDEKQKVSDAKMKQMLKTATDKLSKGASKQQDMIEKFKKNFTQLQTICNQLKQEIEELKKRGSASDRKRSSQEGAD